jgi:fatty-acyl-CoA synthase
MLGLPWLKLPDVRRELRTIVLLGRTKRRLDRLALDGAQTTADAIEDAVDRFRASPAVRFERRTVTYDELDRAANRVAHWARSQGIARGDVIALLMENRPEYLFAWVGLAKLGAVTALINTNLSGSPLVHALTVCSPKAVIVGAELLGAFETARASCSGLPAWVWGDGARAVGDFDLAGAFASVSDERPPRAWRDTTKTSDNLFYIYTSGTTGMPKAARFSHYRFVQVSAAYSVLANVTTSDVVYCCLPLYHTAGGVIAVSLALLNGATLALRRKFSASAFWDDCRTYGVTIFQYIGELCRYLVNRPPSHDDRQHRVRCAIGNGMRPDVWQRFQDRFGIRDVLEFYGATEGNFALINIDNKVGAVGRVPPYLKRLMQVELIRFDVDTETHERRNGMCIRCGPGEVGEAIGRIRDRGPGPVARFEGYTDEEASRKKVLRDVFEKGDAWFRTGDLLYYDADGYYYFVDRIGDTFRWKGENVATSEVAEVLSAFDGVAEANVYGVKVGTADGRAGMAALVCDGGFDPVAFYAYVRERLPAYARPLFVRMKREMETTGTFKHRKVDLVREGFDPAVVAEPIYFRDDRAGTYVELDAALFERITSGQETI